MSGPGVLQVDASLAPADGEAWYFPGARDHGSADIVARVTRRDGTFWTACLDRALALTPSISDHSTVHVFGATGPLWTAQIGSDIGVSSVTPAEVVCDVYDVVTGQSVVRRFDRTTGAPLPAAERELPGAGRLDSARIARADPAGRKCLGP